MQTLKVDYEMRRGHEMKISGVEPLTLGKLHEFELGMLAEQAIPSLLSVDWVEIDGELTFYYSLQSYQMLQQRLRLSTMSMDQYYQLVLGLIDALKSCREYLLRLECCLLEDSCLFVGEGWHEVRLVYVPLRDPKQSTGLLPLLVRWLAYVQEIDGEGLQRMLLLLDQQEWPLEQLRTLMLELLADCRGSLSKTKISQSTVTYPPVVEPPAVGQVNEKSSVQFTNKSYDDWQGLTRGTGDLPAKSLAVEENVRQEEVVEQQDYIDEKEHKYSADGLKRQTWLVSAVLLIAVACLWRFIYLPDMRPLKLMASGGFSLVLVAGYMFYLTKIYRLQEEAENDQMSGQYEEDYEEDYGGNYAEEYEQENVVGLQKVESRFDREYSWQHSGGGQIPQPEEVVGKPALAPTTVIKAPVVMKPKPSVFLAQLLRKEQRDSDAGQQVLVLNGDSYTIGRDEQRVQYVDKGNGISRMHLEIIQTENGYVAKDLGSRNGSLINGSAMIPYKMYSLQHGDYIQLCGIEGASYEFLLEGHRV